MKTVVAGRWNRFSSAHEETKQLRFIRKKYELGQAESQELVRAEDNVTRLVTRELETFGVDMISDGGIGWDSIFDISRKIQGCSGFNQLARIPETNTFHRQPVAKLPLVRSEPILLQSLKFLKSLTIKPVVMCLPGPYSLARQTQNVKTIGLEKLACEYAVILKQEAADLIKNGADLVRIEEHHILNEENDFELFRRVMSRLFETGTDPARLALATWFGSIDAFPDYFELPFGVFFIDFVEGKKSLLKLKDFPPSKQLVAGIFDARHTYEEEDYDLKAAMDSILRYVSAKNVFISTNTDLHFLSWDAAIKKVERMIDFVSRFGQSGTAFVPKKTKASEAVSDQTNLWTIPQTFITSAVGSFPQNQEIRTARQRLAKNAINSTDYLDIIKKHTADWMAFQKKIGLDIPVGGEFIREDMAVFFGVRLGGTALDFVPSYENRCYHPVEYGTDVHRLNKAMTLNEYKFVQSLSDQPVKHTLTGPVTLAHWGLVKNKKYYYSPSLFRMDLARAIRREINYLISVGVKFIQVDEPALPTPGNFKNLAMDLEALHETVRGFKNKAYLILHICYSDMDVLNKAFPSILKLPFHQIHMEMANRNYEMLALIKRHGLNGKDVGLGVTDVHTDRIETVDEIVSGVEKVLPYASPGQIWLLPDCGLKERSDEVSRAKLTVMVEAAKVCRGRFIK